VEEDVRGRDADRGESAFARRWVDREIERAIRIAQTEGWLDPDDDDVVDRIADLVAVHRPPPAVLRYAAEYEVRAAIDADIVAGRVQPELQPDGSFRYRNVSAPTDGVDDACGV
jgi:hypothetical protein